MSTGPYSPFYDHHRWLFPSVDMTGSPFGTHVGHFNQTAMIGASISACSYCTLLPTIYYYCLVPLWSKDKDKDQNQKKTTDHHRTTDPRTRTERVQCGKVFSRIHIQLLYCTVHTCQAPVSCMVCGDGGQTTSCPLWPVVGSFCPSLPSLALSGPLWPSMAHGNMQVQNKTCKVYADKYSSYSTACSDLLLT
jgi:hypothetical protein